jgi:nitrogen regulatory protein PII
MKRIEAIIKPFKFEDVREALAAVGVVGMTVTQVRGFGRQQGHTEVYRGSEYSIDFVPKTKVEILANDSQVEDIVQAITEAAWTGKIGDGKIFVHPLSGMIRIRTGESGPEAL